jgi:mRNA-degrading endonuclease RelE of RelBE toxin-antitoxin system
MSFNVNATEFFLKQIEGLGEKSKRIVREKISLLKENPYRFKRIHAKKFNRVFRVRLSLDGKETRLIYAIIEPNILIVCLLERKNEYKDLEKYLAKI